MVYHCSPDSVPCQTNSPDLVPLQSLIVDCDVARGYVTGVDTRIGRALKFLIEYRKASNAVVMRRASIPKTNFYRHLSGEVTPDIDERERYADALRIPFEELERTWLEMPADDVDVYTQLAAAAVRQDVSAIWSLVDKLPRPRASPATDGTGTAKQKNANALKKMREEEKAKNEKKPPAPPNGRTGGKSRRDDNAA